jgi:hypothetical protein
MAREFVSPLKSWPGSFSLPDPDDFSGLDWKTWKAAVDKPLREPYAYTHLFAYAGLELVARHGDWDIRTAGEEKLPLATVQSWETSPDDERVKLISWIGREVRFYITGIIDPKD